MRIPATGYFFFSVWLLLVPEAGAQGPPSSPTSPEPRLLSLREAVQEVLENNLDLNIERQNPGLREEERIIEKARFDPAFNLQVNGGRTIRPSATAVDVAILAGAVSPIESTSLNYHLGLDQTWWTGTRYSLAWDMNRQGGETTAFNPNYAGALSLKLIQPLLKGFGPEVNQTDIVVARNNYRISQEDLEEKINELLEGAVQSYWQLVFERKAYKVQLDKRRAAQELLAMNRAKVEQGLLAPIEVLTAEAAVADREEEVLTAEKNVRDAEDRLRQALTTARTFRMEEAPIIPTDEPSVEALEIDFDEALRSALEHRPDIQKARLELQNGERRVRRAGNDVLPALDLTGTAGLSGLGPTAREDLDSLTSGDFYNWEVGMVLTVPIGNRAARAAFRKEQGELRKSAAVLEKARQDAALQIRESIRRVQTDHGRIALTRTSRRLAERQLETENERLRLGLTTTRNVLEIQKDLADAQSRELRAVTDYNVSLAHFGRIKGTLLSDWNVVIESPSERE